MNFPVSNEYVDRFVATFRAQCSMLCDVELNAPLAVEADITLSEPLLVRVTHENKTLLYLVQPKGDGLEVLIAAGGEIVNGYYLVTRTAISYASPDPVDIPTHQDLRCTLAPLLSVFARRHKWQRIVEA